jgi:hypothetical protein
MSASLNDMLVRLAASAFIKTRADIVGEPTALNPTAKIALVGTPKWLMEIGALLTYGPMRWN